MTAVELLVDKILVQQEIYIDEEGEFIDIPIIEYLNGYKPHVDLSKFVQEAKEMEKQQIIDAYKEGSIYSDSNTIKLAEQYYNETFKNK